MLSENSGGIRQSLRLLGAMSPDMSGVSPLLSPPQSGVYDLNSRKLRRYIIEDVMFITPGESIVI